MATPVEDPGVGPSNGVGSPLLTIIVVRGPKTVERSDVEVVHVEALSAVRVDALHGDFVVCAGSDESLSIDGLLDLAKALRGAPAFSAARGGFVRVDWSDASAAASS